jgi:zinc/manganese transport system substrate-binding protein
MAVSRRSALAALVLAASAASGTSDASAAAEPPRRLRIVASFSILADLVRNVGGDAVEVGALVGPNADAHAFEPRPADAKRLAEADLVLTNGLGFEGWMDRLVRASGYRGPVVVASQGLTPRRAGRGLDPHAWQDLANARRYVTNLRDALVRLRPAQAALFEANAAAYLDRLAALDAEVRRTFDAVPAERRRAITSHESFGYFADAYGLSFLSAQGRSTDAEASAADVARLIDQIRRQRATAVFVENISDARLVERIAREAGAAVGGRLYSDALSTPGTEADTYLKMFAHNANTIARALQPPAR